MGMLGKVALINKSTVASLGIIGGLGAAKKSMSMLERGTAITSPMFATGAQSKAFGKRGIDSNRLNTSGLAQNLHKNRRKF